MLSTVDVFTKVYDSTANTIMTRTTTSKDIIKIIYIVVRIIAALGGTIYILRIKFKRDKEKAQETIEILKTLLDKTDELKDKYLNKERITMGIISRFTDIMKNNINALLDKCDDPAKMIDHALRNSKEDLAEVKKETANIIADAKTADRQVQECEAKITKYTTAAQNALKAGNEDDARTLIAKKQVQLLL